MSFFIGTIICTIALAIQLGIQPDVARAIPEAAKTGEWYLYIGGPGGAAYISAGEHKSVAGRCCGAHTMPVRLSPQLLHHHRHAPTNESSCALQACGLCV